MDKTRLDWQELLGHLLDFQGWECMVQVTNRHTDRRHTPVLTAFGVMLGGLDDEDFVALNLAPNASGSNGAVFLRRADVEYAIRATENSLTIFYAGLDVGIVRAGDTPAELEPGAGASGLRRGRIVGPEEADGTDDTDLDANS
jgi:hypothetical protein